MGFLAQDCGKASFQIGGIRLYVEDLKQGTNKNIGTKDIFEMPLCRCCIISLYNIFLKNRNSALFSLKKCFESDYQLFQQ
jgi:hypothetical protein